MSSYRGFTSFKSGMEKGSCLCSHFPVDRRINSKIDRTIKGVLGWKRKWVKPEHIIEHTTYSNPQDSYSLYYTPIYGSLIKFHNKSIWDEIGEINIKGTKWYNKVYAKWVKEKTQRKFEGKCECCNSRIEDKRITLCKKCYKEMTKDYLHSLLLSNKGEDSEYKINEMFICDYLNSIPRIMFNPEDFMLYFCIKKRSNSKLRYLY